MIQDLDEARILFDEGSQTILNLTLAAFMFVVALGITIDDFKALSRKPKLVLLGIFSQFLMLPFITYLIVIAFNPRPSIALGMILVAACPGGNISNFLTHLAKGNSALSVSLTAFATGMALFMTPLNFHFYGGLYEPTSRILKTVELNPFELIRLVLLILGIPLLLGMFIRHRSNAFAERISKVLKPLSLIVFIGIIVIAFGKNFDIFQNYIQHVIGIGIGHNLIAMTLGFLLAWSFGLSFRDRKTLSIETGIQNSGLGLVLVFAFFDGLGGMAIMVAFWGIWHNISGLIMAAIWSRYAHKSEIE